MRRYVARRPVFAAFVPVAEAQSARERLIVVLRGDVADPGAVAGALGRRRRGAVDLPANTQRHRDTGLARDTPSSYRVVAYTYIRDDTGVTESEASSVDTGT